jgi:hypothetical protein
MASMLHRFANLLVDDDEERSRLRLLHSYLRRLLFSLMLRSFIVFRSTKTRWVMQRDSRETRQTQAKTISNPGQLCKREVGMEFDRNLRNT